MAMTDKYILEKGYKQYEPLKGLDNDYVVARFQKRFDDDFGKKYFINIIKWSHDYIPACRRNDWRTPFSYEYEIQFSMFESENALDLHLHSSWTLEEVEKFVENFFEKIKPNYYENWDGERRVRPE